MRVLPLFHHSRQQTLQISLNGTFVLFSHTVVRNPGGGRENKEIVCAGIFGHGAQILHGITHCYVLPLPLVLQRRLESMGGGLTTIATKKQPTLVYRCSRTRMHFVYGGLLCERHRVRHCFRRALHRAQHELPCTVCATVRGETLTRYPRSMSFVALSSLRTANSSMTVIYSRMHIV